ncbi:GNAT family N-acetyltransferase [Peptostreptococcaceae bacterium AGR-M142]
MRKVNYSDIDILFNWSNDKDVRLNAFNQNEIKYENHIQWFNNKMKNKNTHMYILMNDNQPIGQIRIDIENKNGIISYSIDKEYRGKGFGKIIIKNIEKIIKEDNLDVLKLIGEVKINNESSKQVFLKNDYKEYFDEEKNCYRYIKELNFIGVIIQARYNSTRLKGKVLKNILDKPLLYYSVKRSSLSKYADKVIVAISNSDDDDKIKLWCDENNIISYVGDEHNVLRRYYEAAKENNLNTIIRVTSDCPFVDPKIIDMLILEFLNFDYDYISNRVVERTWPHGLDVEIFSFEALKKAYNEAVLDIEKEHVTSYILKNKDIFRAKESKLDKNLSNFRLTVDYEEDFELSKILLENLIKKSGIDFDWKDIIKFMKKNKDLVKINENRNDIKF